MVNYICNNIDYILIMITAIFPKIDSKFLISELWTTINKRQAKDQKKIKYNLYKRPRISIHNVQSKPGKSIIKTTQKEMSKENSQNR